MNAEYQRAAPPPRPRKPRLRFSAEIELLDATSRNDIHEGEQEGRGDSSPEREEGKRERDEYEL